MSTEQKTLLVIYPGKDRTTDSTFHILVAETGERLASHYCSHSAYAYGDLYENRPERIKEWQGRFGELDVKYICESGITERTLIERNHAFAAAHPERHQQKDTENQRQG